MVFFFTILILAALLLGASFLLSLAVPALLADPSSMLDWIWAILAIYLVSLILKGKSDS